MAEALEQMLNDFEVPSISKESLYTSIDMYAVDVPVLYSGDFFEPREPLSFMVERKSYKIIGSGAPSFRIDREAHHGKPENHLQYGENLYTGRNGDEAFSILGEILRNNPDIRFPDGGNDE